MASQHRLTPESRAVYEVRDAIKRCLGITLSHGQIQCGLALLERNLAELQTGEGKTAAAVLPLTVLARRGAGVFLATANDYLARRDADWMQPVFAQLGITVGCVTAQSNTPQRIKAYRSDIVYGTLREFGFDYLRDRLAQRQDPIRPPVQCERYAIILDEADSLLIDEARMPLLISQPAKTQPADADAYYRWCSSVAKRLKPYSDYVQTHSTDSIALTDQGRRKLTTTRIPKSLDRVSMFELVHGVERAILVDMRFQRDKHYLVQNGQVLLIDENTGRPNVNRRLGRGYHQAIESREQIAVAPENVSVAQTTVQQFVMKFKHLSGMTATAWESRKELRHVYGLTVRRIPTTHRIIRQRFKASISVTAEQKYDFITAETITMRDSGRPVLIGTTTIEQSRLLSQHLNAAGIEHVVLTARNPEQESPIIAKAGQSGRVTIATNMAGRGTDIRIDPLARKCGGLHVIASQMQRSCRIDRQLEGRCGRQGDPGSYRLFLSLEDELAVYANAVQKRVTNLVGTNHPFWKPILLALFTAFQRRIERRECQDRFLLASQTHQRDQNYLELGLDSELDLAADPIALAQS